MANKTGPQLQRNGPHVVRYSLVHSLQRFLHTKIPRGKPTGPARAKYLQISHLFTRSSHNSLQTRYEVTRRSAIYCYDSWGQDD